MNSPGQLTGFDGDPRREIEKATARVLQGLLDPIGYRMPHDQSIQFHQLADFPARDDADAQTASFVCLDVLQLRRRRQVRAAIDPSDPDMSVEQDH
jgi:hypothetical protein